MPRRRHSLTHLWHAARQVGIGAAVMAASIGTGYAAYAAYSWATRPPAKTALADQLADQNLAEKHAKRPRPSFDPTLDEDVGAPSGDANAGPGADGMPRSGPHSHHLTTFLTPQSARFLRLFPRRADSLGHPSGLVVAEDQLYCLYRGDLYAAPLESVVADGLPDSEQVPLRSVMPVGRQLEEGGRIRELLHVSWDPVNRVLVCIDKSNDVYLYQPATGRWAMEIAAKPGPTMPDPHYVASAFSGGRLYVLDYARNQIWHKLPGRGEPRAYFRKDVPAWEVKRHPGAHDLTTAIDMDASGNDLVALTEGGWLRTFRDGAPAEQLQIRVPAGSSHLGAQPLDSWSDLAISPNHRFAYIVDSDNARVLAVSRRSGAMARQLVVAPVGRTALPTHAVALTTEKVLIVAGGDLVVYPREGAYAENSVGDAACPTDVVAIANAAGLQDARLTGFRMPIAELLPDNISVFPGARRIYRHGIHEGVDFFDRHDPKGGGKYVTYGSPVVAAADGEVVRVDQRFVEMRPDEHRRVLTECVAMHETSRYNENRFRGRQVHIRHANGAVSVYAHLGTVAPGLKPGGAVRAGQPIGTVGNSGTSNGVAGTRAYPHLHFEIWLNGFDTPTGEYFGRYLTPWETMRLWEKAFPGQAKRTPGRSTEGGR